MLEKIKQACRASTEDDLERGLPGHLYELTSLYNAKESGATLLDATKKADTLYDDPKEGLIATQNKWASSMDSMGGNIYAALRQLAGQPAKGNQEKNKNSEPETPPENALRVADVAIPLPGPENKSQREELIKQVTDIYNKTAINELPQLKGRRNEIRLAFVNSELNKIERYTFSTDNQGEQMSLTGEPPQQTNKGKETKELSPGDARLLDIPECVKVFRKLGPKQRLNLLD